MSIRSVVDTIKKCVLNGKRCFYLYSDSCAVTSTILCTFQMENGLDWVPVSECPRMPLLERIRKCERMKIISFEATHTTCKKRNTCMLSKWMCRKDIGNYILIIESPLRVDKAFLVTSQFYTNFIRESVVINCNNLRMDTEK